MNIFLWLSCMKLCNVWQHITKAHRILGMFGSDLHNNPLFNLTYLNMMQKTKTRRRLHIIDLFTQRDQNCYLNNLIIASLQKV